MAQLPTPQTFVLMLQPELLFLPVQGQNSGGKVKGKTGMCGRYTEGVETSRVTHACNPIQVLQLA